MDVAGETTGVLVITVSPREVMKHLIDMYAKSL